MFNTNKKLIFVFAFIFVNALFFSENVFAQRKRIKYDIIDQRGGKKLNSLNGCLKELRL